MIVHTLVMCTGDAGPEQSLVLFLFFTKPFQPNGIFHKDTYNKGRMVYFFVYINP